MILPVLSDEEMKAINDAQPADAKYGDVFKAIAQAQRDADVEALFKMAKTLRFTTAYGGKEPCAKSTGR